MLVQVINGPNLNLLGSREPEIYGSETLADLEDRVALWANRMGVDVEFAQSNDEGAIVAPVAGVVRRRHRYEPGSSESHVPVDC